ncbi:type II secretion system F family protein [Streptomyces rugosispiralis]|uniref:Type II secretion system F family protein n=1 Tax=Streptomyces rugosispiralis TaxID=2967341 RepID=A0ABT1V2W4_9ACTN|nr:type II secretion system F family protein [Streptomyces rugosispiralis]MCQ8190891.1 type II secretion system F family protein [Streptomyces rugosispiralis]
MSTEVVHSLGISLAFLAAALCTAMAMAEARRERCVRRRLAVLLPGAAEDGRPSRARPWRRWCAGAGVGALPAWAAPGGALTIAVVLVGGPPGWALGLAAACGLWRWQRHRRATAGRSGSDRRLEALAAGQIPLAADLLTACLAAGAGPRRAAEAVGGSLGGPVGERLAQTAAELRLGGEPAHAWGRIGALPGAQGLARALERAGVTGAPAVEPVSRLAAECRAEQGREAMRRADRTGVLVNAPLAGCFLPAFLLVGLAPVMIGLARGLAGDGP